jgi:hydrogenase maturation protease
MLKFLKTHRGSTSAIVTLQPGKDGDSFVPAAARARARDCPDASTALVLGFGNVLLSDDGAGVRLLDRLRTEVGPHVADFVDGGTLSFTLLPLIQATDALLVIDAADLKATAGSIELFEGGAMDQFLATACRRTVHEIGLIDLLHMARLQGSLPPRRALLCIQPAHIEWSAALSEPVLQAFPDAIRQAQALLARWEIL